MKKSIAANSLLIILILFCSGCMATLAHTDFDGGSVVQPGAYPGVRFGAQQFKHDGRETTWILPLVLLDLPLTAICDTLWLPFDLAYGDKSQKRSDE